MKFIIKTILLVAIILYLNYKKKLRLKREEEERLHIAEEKKRIEELALLHDRQRKELNPFLDKIAVIL